MVRRHFGTDGIRGRANSQITADVALKVGQAAGLAFRRGDHRHRVVIGKDTRLSSYMIGYALVAGSLPSGSTCCCWARFRRPSRSASSASASPPQA
jgi:phosphomannomutase